MYNPARSQLALEEASRPCVAYIMAVGKVGGRAVLYVYNAGLTTCRFDVAYLVDRNAMYQFGGVAVPPGNVTRIATELEYCAGCVYKLTGPNGEEALGRAQS